MTQFIEEYHDLVRETRLLLQNEIPTFKPPPPLPPPPKINPPLPEVSLELEESISSPPKVHKQVVGSFTLEKSTPFTPLDLTSIRTTLHPSLPPTTLLSFFPSHMSFLKKIADALIQHRLSCQTLLITDKTHLKQLLSSESLKTLITEFDPQLLPLISLTKEVEYHKFFPFSSQKRILFMHPIPLYQSDIERKRHLWNSLKILLPQ